MGTVCLASCHEGLIELMLQDYPYKNIPEIKSREKPRVYWFHGLDKEQLRSFLKTRGYELSESDLFDDKLN